MQRGARAGQLMAIVLLELEKVKICTFEKQKKWVFKKNGDETGHIII
jgi:hypothetical protein